MHRDIAAGTACARRNVNASNRELIGDGAFWRKFNVVAMEPRKPGATLGAARDRDDETDDHERNSDP